MQLLATLGDAPTAAIAVVAIVVGLLLAARGSRDKRSAIGAVGEAPAGPSLLSVPVSAPAVEPQVEEPGFVGPEGTIVGHGTIRFGAGESLLDPVQPATPVWVPPAAPAPPVQPVVSAEPAAPAEPAPPGEPESAFPGQPVSVFRQGRIKLGGRPAGKPPADG